MNCYSLIKLKRTVPQQGPHKAGAQHYLPEPRGPDRPREVHLQQCLGNVSTAGHLGGGAGWIHWQHWICLRGTSWGVVIILVLYIYTSLLNVHLTFILFLPDRNWARQAWWCWVNTRCCRGWASSLPSNIWSTLVQTCLMFQTFIGNTRTWSSCTGRPQSTSACPNARLWVYFAVSSYTELYL